MLNIKLKQFEGPLGLLLQLIEKQEMDITEVSLASVAGQYVNYIKSLDKINPEEMADFLVVATRLLLIKSKALLPYLRAEEEEEIEEFEKQLKMYKEFLEAMKQVEARLKKKKFMFAREFNRKAILSLAPGISLFSPPKKLTAKELAAVFQGIIGNLELIEDLEEEVIERKVKIEDKIMAIQKMLINRINISFKKVFTNTESKTDIIVSFLAMLELVKQRNINVTQKDLFEDIEISKNC